MITFLRRLITRRFEPLTKREVAVLRVVCLFEPVRGIEIANRLRVYIGWLYPVLYELEEYGYIAKVKTPYRITEKGRRYLVSIKSRD